MHAEKQSAAVLEVAILDVIPSLEAQFEQAFAIAQRIIAASSGYRGHELRRCAERANRYVLLVHWDTIEHHTIGFRGSVAYQEWRQLLHRFYDPFPTVEHYTTVALGPV